MVIVGAIAFLVLVTILAFFRLRPDGKADKTQQPQAAGSGALGAKEGRAPGLD